MGRWRSTSAIAVDDRVWDICSCSLLVPSGSGSALSKCTTLILLWIAAGPTWPYDLMGLTEPVYGGWLCPHSLLMPQDQILSLPGPSIPPEATFWVVFSSLGQMVWPCSRTPGHYAGIPLLECAVDIPWCLFSPLLTIKIYEGTYQNKEVKDMGVLSLEIRTGGWVEMQKEISVLPFKC